MNFTDYIFLPALFIVFAFYFLLPLRKRWIWLLIASFLFFASWGVDMIPLILFINAVAWVGGLLIEKNLVKDAADKKTAKEKLFLFIPTFIILGILIYSKIQKTLIDRHILLRGVIILSTIHEKIRGFFAEIPICKDFLSAIPENSQNLSFFYRIIIPLGISYYTLSLISYLVEIYWGQEKAERNYFKLLLFMLYFPKIIEGPISRHQTLASQLIEGHRFDYDRFCMGLQRILWGYFKKLVISDRLIILVNAVFDNYQAHYGSEFLFIALISAVQLYCDFSGCMDIALGFSSCLGIDLEENFNRPFYSRSAAEFWRRWHITLGTWFKDYIFSSIIFAPGFIRLTGKIRKKCGKRFSKAIASAIPLLAVWLLTGLWHGTGVNFLVWGGYWWVIITFSGILEPEFKKLTKALRINTKSSGYHVFQIVRTYVLYAISRLITLPGSLAVTQYAIRSIFSNFGPWKLLDGSLFELGVSRPQFAVLVLAIGLLWFMSYQQEKGVEIRKAIAAKPLPIRWIIYLAGIFIVLIFGAYGAGVNTKDFVYMQY